VGFFLHEFGRSSREQGSVAVKFLFGDHTLDSDRRELRRGSELVQLQPQVFDLLLHIIQNRERVVSRDELIATIWRGRFVSDATVSSRIKSARHAISDTGERQEFIRTVSRRGLRFVGDVRDISQQESAQAAPAPKPAQVTGAAHAKPHQEVTFCRTADGVTLAVATSGHGPPIVKTANWLNHIEFDWQSPVWSPLLGLLGSHRRLIRYDERGTGLSDWKADTISFEAFVQDLEAVVDALGLDRFALFGISQGAPISIAYATRHPERVSRLVLFGGYLQGWRKRGTPEQIAQRATMLSLVPQGWGQDNPAFRQLFTSVFIPGATLEEMHWFNDMQRVSTSPENAVRLIEVFGDIDISGLLPRVATPTLVLHSRDDALIPFEQGLRLARGIPDARFVTLESRNHLLVEHEPAWPRFVDEVSGFLAHDVGAKPAGADSVHGRPFKLSGVTRQPSRRPTRRRRERRP
jgi:pimeloyl-ACP methyl ester carboxylesterase/DNA-binding winged helix-turn-helix (wHTH) protein